MRPLYFILFSLLILTSAEAQVRVVGSDLLGKDFETGLAAFSKRNDLGITTKMEGSRAALERLQSGLGDLGVVMLAPGEKAPEAPFVTVRVAYQTAVVAVPASLPISQITFVQLNTIYGDEAQTGLRRWGDLGVTGEWAQRNILPNILGPSGGLSYDLFRYGVLGTPALRPTVAVQSTLSESLARIRGEEGGVAVLPLLPAGESRLKTLLVARGAQDVAFGPTPENIHSGDYPIRLPVYLVFRKDAAKRLQTTLRYLLSEDAVPLWESAQLVPLPVQARNQQLFDLEVL